MKLSRQLPATNTALNVCCVQSCMVIVMWCLELDGHFPTQKFPIGALHAWYIKEGLCDVGKGHGLKSPCPSVKASVVYTLLQPSDKHCWCYRSVGKGPAGQPVALLHLQKDNALSGVLFLFFWLVFFLIFIWDESFIFISSPFSRRKDTCPIPYKSFTPILASPQLCHHM